MRYMLIDTTTVEGTRLLAIAPLRAAQLLGKVEQLANGRTVIAPPVEGRGFAKLDMLQLQYLFWNTFQEVPPNEFSQACQVCLERFTAMPDTPADIDALERQVALLAPDNSEAASSGGSPVATKVRSSAPSVRPAGTSTTGKVWEVADQIFGEQDPKSANWKVVREAIVKACEELGINGATAATQYSKWKKAKEGSNQ